MEPIKSLKTRYSRVIWTYFDLILLSAPLIVVAFGVVIVGLLLIGHLDTYLALFLGTTLSALFITLTRFVQKKNNHFLAYSNERLIFTLLAIGFIIVAAFFNSSYNSEHVFVNRDPGIYTVTAKLVAEGKDLRIQKGTTLKETAGFYSASAGFDTSTYSSDELYAQGTHMVSGVLGWLARFFGDKLIFNGNIIFACFALLSFFAFSTRFIKARFAFLAMVSVSTMLPFIYFSRDLYTEIAALAIVFGAFPVLHAAISHKSKILWLFAGLLVGAGAMIRIDAYLTIAALVIFIGVYLASRSTLERSDSVRQAILFLVGASLAAGVGYLDLILLSSGYFNYQWPEIFLELILLGVSLVSAVTLILLSWNTKIISSAIEHSKKWRGQVLVASMILFWLFMGTRFLWWSGLRDNAELTVVWIGAYLGPIIFLLAIIGLSIILFKIQQTKKNFISLAPFFLVLSTTAVIYITYPSIAPDHVWASRRMLPIVLPGMIFAAFYFLNYLSSVKNVVKNSFLQKTLLYTLAVVVAISPLYLTRKFIYVAPFRQVSAMQEICDSIPRQGVVVLIGRAGFDATVSSSVFCGFESYRYLSANDEIAESVLASAHSSAAAKGKELYVMLYERDIALVPGSSEVINIATRTTENIELVYRKLPQKITIGYEQVLAGKVNAAGKLMIYDQDRR